MALDPELRNIQLIFETIRGAGSSSYFPPIQSLANGIRSVIGSRTTGHVTIASDLLTKFATGSVEVWHRAIHSFLISASLTDTSPVWASVAGYYSSHYTMRAISHLFGYFQFYRPKVIVNIDPQNIYSLFLSGKNAESGEHKGYWKFVKQHRYFRNDPLFTDNPDIPTTRFTEFFSDHGHRNRANYADHIGDFRTFNPLDSGQLRSRIEYLSNQELEDPSIPDVAKYPDIISVQLVAYHRLLRYRGLLDQLLSTQKGFWSKQRKPNWAPTYFDFQATSPRYTMMYDDYLKERALHQPN